MDFIHAVVKQFSKLKHILGISEIVLTDIADEDMKPVQDRITEDITHIDEEKKLADTIVKKRDKKNEQHS